MKEYFATIGLTLIPFAVSFACCYLIGSFIGLSFDPSMWTEQMRMFMSLVGVLFGGALYAKVENAL
jgi:hypothetical protein